MITLLNKMNLYTRKQYEELEIEVLTLRKKNYSLESENTKLKEKATQHQDELNRVNKFYKTKLYNLGKGKSKAA